MKRISSGNLPGCCIVTDLFVATGSQLAKFEDKNLQKRIDSFAADLKIKWHIESGIHPLSAIEKEIPSPITDETLHDMEMTHYNFLKYVDELPDPKKEDDQENPDLIKFDDAKEETMKDKMDFAKQILKEFDDEYLPTVGAVLLCSPKCNGTPFALDCGNISRDMLRMLFQAFVEKYGRNEEQ